MNTSDIADHLAGAHGVTKADAKKMVDGVFAAITAAAAKGDEVSIPGFGNTELCVFDGNNCSAANNHAVIPATQDRIGFTLTTGLVDELSFTDFAVKWAGVGRDSFEAGGSISVAPVPLPAAGGLLLAGLAGLVALRRKRIAA